MRLYCLAFIFLVSTLRAQDGPDILTNYQKFNVSEGLPSQLIKKVYQDNQGFIWIISNFGISRFDGVDFVNYVSNNSVQQMPDVDQVVEDQSGRFWLFGDKQHFYGEKATLFIFDPAVRQLSLFTEFQFDDISSIAVDENQKILFGTEQGEVYSYLLQDRKLEYQATDKTSITNILITESGIWLAQTSGKILLLDHAFVVQKEWQAKGKVVFICEKNDKDLIIREIIKEVDGSSDRILDLKLNEPELQVSPVNDFNTKKAVVNETWSYCARRQLLVYSDGTGTTFLVSAADDNSKFLSLSEGKAKEVQSSKESNFIDNQANLWLSTSNGVLLYPLLSSKFQTFLSNDDSQNNLYDITRVGDLLYCHSNSGRYLFDLETSQILNDFSNANKSIGAACANVGDSLIYFTDQEANLYAYNILSNEEKQYSYKNGELEDLLFSHLSIFSDKQANIWLGSNNGLAILNQKLNALERYSKYNEFELLNTASVFEIKEFGNFLWIASNKGLFKLDKDRGIIAHYYSGQPKPGYLPSDDIRQIHIDANGMLWLATLGSGILKFDPQTSDFQQLTTANGLPHNIVHAIMEDSYGYLWISTDDGLARLDRKNAAITVFTKADGLPYDKFALGVNAKTSDGKLVFGGVNGLIAFDPKDFMEGQQLNETPLRLTSVLWDASPIDYEGNKIFVANQEGDLEIRFRLLDYTRTDEVLYKWRVKNDPSYKELKYPLINLQYLSGREKEIEIIATDLNGNIITHPLIVTIFTPSFIGFEFYLYFVCLLALILGLWFLYKEKNIPNKNQKTKDYVAVTSPVVLPSDKIDTPEVKETLTTIPKAEPTTELIELSPSERVRLAQLKQIVLDSLEQNGISVSDLAVEMNLSVRQLNRVVKNLSGLTPNQFIRDLKLARAKGFLESGKFNTVAEVSYAVGFEKPDYFSRLFNEKYGKRPVEYFSKKQYKNDL